MANELTIGTAVESNISQLLGQGVKQIGFSGAAGDLTATPLIAAPAAGSKIAVLQVVVSVDTAGETLSMSGFTDGAILLSFPVADCYVYKFNPPLELPAATALTLDKNNVAAVVGVVHYAVVTAGASLHV